MKTVTKRTRALRILSIMQKQRDSTQTLACWLNTINQDLTQRFSLRSTKELAYTFKYMVVGMNVNILKHKGSAKISGCKAANTYYTLLSKKSTCDGKPMKQRKIKTDCLDYLLVRAEEYE